MKQTNDDSEVFTVKKRVVRVKISEEEIYTVRTPLISETLEYQKRMKECPTEEVYNVVKETLTKLGLPAKAIEEHFDLENLLHLWEKVSEKKSLQERI